MELLLLGLLAAAVAARSAKKQSAAAAPPSPRPRPPATLRVPAAGPIDTNPTTEAFIRPRPPAPVQQPPAPQQNFEEQGYDAAVAKIPGYGGVIAAGDKIVDQLPGSSLAHDFIKNPLLGQVEVAKAVVNDALDALGLGGSHHASVNAAPLAAIPGAGALVRRDSVDTDSVYFYDGVHRHNVVPRSIIDALGEPVYTVRATVVDAVPETFTVTSAAQARATLADPNAAPPPSAAASYEMSHPPSAGDAATPERPARTLAN